ncbi:interferon-induced very large GTPase 1-like [Mercenaria mercenaria]|uniref:interferon-induced very large GTPase 1-like n=1 Tax=Mercenaria mercenaria TaxID=6596 RepID=UPI00234F896F|nr:interferon-induced very large GTPase 1-like [Mercenaria mercenaria]
MFWLPKVCTEKDRFKDPVVLLNLRGDIRQYTSDTCLFISNISDLFVIVINIKNLKNDRLAIETAIKHFKRIIFIITDSEHEVDEIEGVLETFLPPLEKEKQIVEVEFTYQRNMLEIASTVTAIINEHSSSEYNTLEKRLIDVDIVTDEQSEICTKGKAIARNIFQKIEFAGQSPEIWKSTVTPVHYKYSPELGSLMKRMQREKDEDERETLIAEIERTRHEQLENITDTVRYFLRNIIKYQNQKPLLGFVLCWLTVFIDRKKRTIMPTLTKQNLTAWEKRKEIVSRDSKAIDQINENEKLIVETENAIRAASFGIENLFREIGHIYDAAMTLSISPDSKKLPSIQEVVSVYAELFLDGHTLEIIDGESFYMPYEWIKSVMEVATKKIESKKVFAISALGLQSSGKSTLLNTMFGLQFETSSGRCTRGINIHLVHINQPDKMQVPFDYVLVVDTEGLRAPELMHDKHEHDNELATVITGLGDITIINIMGENFSEMSEVLQVVVTAFLRLKLANRSLDVRKSCVLVQQNITELSAHDKLKPALRKAKEELDKKTKESAEMHGIQDIKTFDQLIEFDIPKQVCYLPNMWQGNPPLAVVNLEYTNRVSSVKYQLIEIATLIKSKTYKTLIDLATHANDLWQGVLAEDFVFSFKNSLEIKVFVQLEQKMQTHLSEFESSLYEKFLEMSREIFCKCENEKGLTNAKQNILNDIEEIWSEQYSSLEKEMSNYFDKHDNKDIIMQYDEYSTRRVEASCLDLLNQLKVDVDNFKEERSIDILINESKRAHEDTIYDRTLQLAKELKGQNLEREKLDKDFYILWDTLVSDAQLYQRRVRNNESMRKAFINCLYKNFLRFTPMLTKQLKKTNMLTMPVPGSFGSFDNIGITTEDIKLPEQNFLDGSQGKEDIGQNVENEKLDKDFDMAIVKEDVENLLKHVNEIIEKYLSENKGEISSHNVKSLIKQVDEVLRKMPEKKQYSLQQSFQIKFLVYISWYCHDRFENHNADNRENRSTEVRLQRYQGHMLKIFYARLQDRKAEETAALSLSQTIENVLRDAVSEILPLRIWSALSSHFPKLKGQLIVKILEDLVKKNNFKLFARFNHTPKSYAEEWIKAEAELFLFCKKRFQYSRIASTVIAELFADIKNGIESNVKDTSDKTTILSFEDWIRGFIANLKKCQIPEIECLRAKRELTDERLDLKNLKEILLNKLSSLETDLKNEFSSQGNETVEWFGRTFNPCDKLIKQIWGCDAQCPFCLEPCAKNSNHDGVAPHRCFQHKLRCCTGVRKVESKAARLSSCNYDVRSTSTYRCDYLNYICNPEKQEPCKNKRHKYSDYKRFFADWDIQPNANIDDKPKFWMWFMVRYEQQIKDYYKMNTSKIPVSWRNISESEALKSLRMSYIGK